MMKVALVFSISNFFTNKNSQGIFNKGEAPLLRIEMTIITFYVPVYLPAYIQGMQLLLIARHVTEAFKTITR